MNRFKAAIVVVLVFLMTGLIFAWPAKSEGKPVINVGAETGYFIWHDTNGWHLRVTTDGGTRSFSGRIITRGNIRLNNRVAVESPDYVRKVRPQVIEFKLRNSGAIDGFDFSTSGAFLRFNLLLDGKRAPVSQIYTGSGRFNPPRNPMVISW